MISKRRGYINVDIEVTERVRVSDILDQVPDEDILAEANDRDLIKPVKQQIDLNRDTISDFFGK